MEQNESIEKIKEENGYVRILPEDNYVDVAQKIFNHFKLNQSCIVFGFVKDEEKKQLYDKGNMVLELLREYDAKHNTTNNGDGRIRRKRKIIPNSIGGYVAQKIFCYEQVVHDGIPKTRIWRVQ